MARGITEQDVFQAADALLTNGQRPTIERVRRELGRGSPNTVNKLLDQWWASLSARMTAKEPNDLPAEVNAAFKRFYDELRRRAAEAVAGDVQGLQASLDAERQSLESQRTAVSHRREALDAVVTALRADLAAVSRENVRLATRTAELESQAAAAVAGAKEALKQRDTAMAHVERGQKAAEQQLEKIRAQWEGNERHWLKQINELRDALKRSQQDREREGRQQQRRIDELVTQAQKAEHGTAELRSKAEQLTASALQERERRIAAEAELAGARRIKGVPKKSASEKGRSRR